MITTISQKLEIFQQLGLEAVFIMRFDEKVANMEPVDFVKKYLIGVLRAKEIFLGEGFRFGKGRSGGVDLLKEIGREWGFRVYEVKKKKDEIGRIISSTLIRELLLTGKVKEAGDLLGRLYEIRGVLVPGLGIARKLGFPTLNIKPLNEILPKGIFSGYLEVKSRFLPVAVYIGTRPTHGGKELTVEAHVLEGEVMGRLGEEVKLILKEKIREERKFPSEKELVAQIFDDLRRIRKALKTRLN
jgi:riboflavin kinase/FMN adenylyltransferase